MVERENRVLCNRCGAPGGSALWGLCRACRAQFAEVTGEESASLLQIGGRGGTDEDGRRWLATKESLYLREAGECLLLGAPNCGSLSASELTRAEVAALVDEMEYWLSHGRIRER